MRTHVVLPEALVKEVDQVAGARKRSQFIEEAVRRRLLHERQRRAFERAAGVFTAEDHPHWATPEKTDSWLQDLRKQDDERSGEIWQERGE